MTKKFFIIEPFATSYEYIFILNDIRENRKIDLEINVVMVRPREFYDVNYKVELAPYDNLYFIEDGDIVITSDDIVIAGCDAALPLVTKLKGDTDERLNKAKYLSKISYPNRIDDFYLNIPNNTIEDSLSWATDRFPVVMKPVNGTGSRDVFMIYSKEELRAMLEYTMNKNNSTEYLLQEKIEGTEYQLDITSMNGSMGVIAIWSAVRGRHGYSWLENYEDLPKALQDSIHDVIGQLKEQFKIYGLYHVETIFDGSNLRIIEINFRNHGHMPYDSYKSGTGWAHTEVELISHLWPKFWLDTFSEKIIPRKEFVARCWIKNYIKRYISFDVESLKEHVGTVKKISGRPDLYGKIVDPSIGFFNTHIASVMLHSSDENVLRSDVIKLFEWTDARYG